MPIFEIRDQQIQFIQRTTFEEARLKERDDLQRMLRDRISVVLPDVLVIAEEFGDWEDSRRRVDLLGVERDESLVVIELKRTEDGGHMDLQAIRYAAMVSAMTFEQAVEAFGAYLAKRGVDMDARAELLDFLDHDQAHEERFAWDVRIALIAADFSRELTTAVLWLNQRGLDIRCVRVHPYADGERVLLDVQQVIPLPEAEEYQVKLREKAASERASLAGQTSREERFVRFWTQLLKRASSRTDLHSTISPSKANWMGVANHGISLCYAVSRGTGRVEIYLGRSDPDQNWAIFEELRAAKAEIESRFGEPLDWQELPGKAACRLASMVPALSFEDDESWADLQEQMIDRMIRLEEACRPQIGKYRAGEKPAG